MTYINRPQYLAGFKANIAQFQLNLAPLMVDTNLKDEERRISNVILVRLELKLKPKVDSREQTGL
jgi:hypothetical protein